MVTIALPNEHPASTETVNKSEKKETGEMICFKSCTECSGDQMLESEWYGRYVFCLKCLHVTFPKAASNTLLPS